MEGQSFEPVKIRSDQVVEEEREVLFYIDDREYTIAKEVRPNITISYLRDTLEHGQEYALAAAMEEVLGADAMADLAESDSVGEEQMRQIMNIIEGKLLSARRKQLGNSRSGPRR